MEKNIPLWRLLRYFLWLGTFGFGGPIALIGHMQRDLVEHKKWISREDYLHGIALAQVCPGPFATQVAMYLGWMRSGFIGATLVAIALILPSFIMVIALASFYVQHGNIPLINGLLFGIGAGVLGIIIQSAIKLALFTNTHDRLLWLICFSSVMIAIFFSSYTFLAFIISGMTTLMLEAPPKIQFQSSLILPSILTSGINSITQSSVIIKMMIYFFGAGALIFGGGLAIVPLLNHQVVNEFHWLTQQQFVDAVSVGMITPGPMLITVAFIGYLVAGFAGALLAAISVFLPSYLCVILLSPYYRRLIKNVSLKAFVRGVTASAAGAVLGATFTLGKQSITNIKAFCIFSTVLFCLLIFKKIPQIFLLLGAGIAGILLT